MRVLGLDIGSNSVGSAWVDLEKKKITLGVSVFPAGVDERDDKRGAPKNQKRRQTRSQRRSICRRAKRKRRLRALLTKYGLLPSDPAELHRLMTHNIWPVANHVLEENIRTPWHLRREGLFRELSPYEFGRVLVHLNQRRGALGILTDDDESDEGKVKDAIDRTRKEMGNRTFGQMMADLYDERVTKHLPIRNRRDSFEFHADRQLIRGEFQALWKKQQSFGGELGNLLTDQFLAELDSPIEDETWRHKGEIFGQRQTYWDAGTLGRCELEPSDHQCPLADMYAQEYRVVESVNNIRIKARDERDWRPLTHAERRRVIDYLRGGWFTPFAANSKRPTKAKRAVKAPKPEHIREVLGIDKKALAKKEIHENFYQLNLESDPERELNTDWFYRNIVHDVFGEQRWLSMTDRERGSVNRAILKFDPADEGDADALRTGAIKWWKLEVAAAEKLVEAWKGRPNIEKRLKLSRRAIRNLLPYMNCFDECNNRWPTQIEARKQFSEDISNGATEVQRARYALGGSALGKSSRHFLKKHPNELPPAPMISNPVVRKAIHEVRRHLNHYIRRFKAKPDRVVIEFVRGVKDTAKQRNKQLAENRAREKERKEIEAKLKAWGVPRSNWKMATLRMRLRDEQDGICPFSLEGPYSSHVIGERMAAAGVDVEIEHIIPESITGKTLDFNNVVLCFRKANRDKGQRTPLDWLGPEKLAEVMRRLENTAVRDNTVKWERLQAATPDADQYRNSQLTDSAYAARQVAEYVSGALYLDKSDNIRRVFTTKGQYTARLRADWGLYESDIDRAHGLEPPIDEEELSRDPELVHALRRARKDPTKDRIDHRHHAMDALVVALTPEYISKIGEAAAKDREYYERVGKRPRRTPIDPPWGHFRSDAIKSLDALVVAHRPEKRRIIGALHKETAYGKAPEYPGLYTERMPAANLKHTQLIEPVYDSRAGVWRIPGKGQGRAIRDPGLRREVILSLQRNGIDPSSFSERDIKALTSPDEWKLRTLSGVPIKSLTMLLAMSDPISITGKDGVERYFMGGNNHHMEILEDERTHRWSSVTWDMQSVARRVRPLRGQRKLPTVIGRQLPQLLADGALPDELAPKYQGKRFVMSLAIGETLFLKHKETKTPGYFVVYKLDAKNAYLHPHWDSRRASGKGIENPRDEIKLSANQIQELVVDPRKIKVKVSPLGAVSPLLND